MALQGVQGGAENGHAQRQPDRYVDDVADDGGPMQLFARPHDFERHGHRQHGPSGLQPGEHCAPVVGGGCEQLGHGRALAGCGHLAGRRASAAAASLHPEK